MKRTEMQVGKVYIRRAPSSNKGSWSETVFALVDAGGYNKDKNTYDRAVKVDVGGRGVLGLLLERGDERAHVSYQEIIEVATGVRPGIFVASNCIWDEREERIPELVKRRLATEEREAEMLARREAQKLGLAEIRDRLSVLGLDDVVVRDSTYDTVTVPMQLLSDLLASAAWPGLVEITK